MFPVSDSSSSIVDCLLNEARRVGGVLISKHWMKPFYLYTEILAQSVFFIVDLKHFSFYRLFAVVIGLQWICLFIYLFPQLFCRLVGRLVIFYVDLREGLKSKYLKVMMVQKCFALNTCFYPLGVHGRYVLTICFAELPASVQSNVVLVCFLNHRMKCCIEGMVFQV